MTEIVNVATHMGSDRDVLIEILDINTLEQFFE